MTARKKANSRAVPAVEHLLQSDKTDGPRVELNEVGRRIVGQHWMTIFVLVAVSVGIAVAVHSGDAATYTASSRIVLGTDDPKTSSESLAISDTAWAIATAPAQLRMALVSAHARPGDLDEIATRVKVKAVGASGVLDLSFSDESPRVAAAVANALAAQVRRARSDAGQGELHQLLADIDGRIERINRQIRSLSARSRPTPAETGLRDSLNQQRAVLETQRVSALFEQSRNPSPSVVSAANVPTRRDSSGELADILLAAVLGLVAGTGLAAMLETFRPTVVGGDALARELDVPLLGTLPSPSAETHDEGASAVSWRLRMAARTAGIRNVGLVPVRRDGVDVAGVGRLLVGSETEAATAGGELRSFDIRSSPVLTGPGTGIVILAPEAIKRTELDELRNLLRVTTGPLLGVVTHPRYSPSRIRRLRDDATDQRMRRSA